VLFHTLGQDAADDPSGIRRTGHSDDVWLLAGWQVSWIDFRACQCANYTHSGAKTNKYPDESVPNH